MKTNTTAKLALAILATGLFVATGSAQTPEFRYWNGQAAQNWARSGAAAYRGNVPGALYYQYRGAQDTGRALYFGSSGFEQNRSTIINSPSWDRNRNYFRR